MTRREQERLVGRYIGGELTGAEEQDFFIQVAVDNDLRQTLKAYQVVDSALHKHRETIPVQHPESRERMVMMLRQSAAAAPAQQQAVWYKPGIAAIVGGWFNRRTAFVSATAFIWMIAGFSAFALITGAIVVVPMITDDAGQEAKPPAAVRHVAQPQGTSNAPAQQKLSEIPTTTDSAAIEQATLRSGTTITTTETLPAARPTALRNPNGTSTFLQRRAIATASQSSKAAAQAKAEEAAKVEEASTAKRPVKDTINARAKVKVLRP